MNQPHGLSDVEQGAKALGAMTGELLGAERPVPEVMNRVFQFFGEWRARFLAGGPTPPSCLYHYTGVDALVKIVSTNELWGTNAVFMNDQTEISHAASLLARVVEADASGPPNAGFSTSRVSSDGAIRQVLMQLHSYIEVYVACFCVEPDLLSQWRGYGGLGGGYAIGFGPEGLKALGGGALSLVHVVYDEAEQERQIRDLVNGWRSVFDPEMLLEDGWSQGMAAALFAQAFGLLATSFKNKAFAEEQEWRLLYLRPRFPKPLPDEFFTLDFRTHNGLAVPFVRFVPRAESGSVAQLPIESIHVGPNRYPNLAASGVWHLLNRYGLGEQVKIVISAAPLRT
jgi:hypothetical protein